MTQPSTSPLRAHVHPAEIGLLTTLALVMGLFTLTTTHHGDEFTNLYNAVRMAHGEVIYRDFFEITAPLTHGILAVVFAVTGPSLLVARGVQAVAIVVSGWQSYRLARSLDVGPWAATLPGLVLVLGLYRNWPGYSHHWIALPIVLAGLQLAMRGLERPTPRIWAATGAAVGLAGLAMQSDGAMLALVVAGAALLHGLLGGWTVRRAAPCMLALAAGAAVPLALATGYFAWHGALAIAWQDVWVWPLTHYKVPGGFNDIPFATDLPAALLPVTELPGWYGRLFYLVCLYALPPLMAVFAVAWGMGILVRRATMNAGWTTMEAKLGLVGLMTVGFLALLTRGRADLVRVAVYAYPAVLFATALAQRWASHFTTPDLVVIRRLPYLALASFVATGALLQAKFVMKAPQAWLRLQSPDVALSNEPAIRYIRAHAEPGDRLAAMPNGGFYYFYGLPPATRYPWIWPPELGFVTTHEFESAWREIRAHRPRFIVVAPDGPTPAQLAAYVRSPLVGYRRIVFAPDPASPVYVFEREAAPASDRPR